jgi:hypothetical protein
MRTSRLSITLLVPLAALAVAGCGGGGSSTSDTTQAKAPEKPAALSKASFISQGDGICGEVNAAVGSIDEKESEEASSYERAAQVATLYIGMIERLTKLGTPSETEGYGEFSEAAEMFAKVENEVNSAAEEENSAALEEASNAAVPALEQFQSEAAIYGFEDCSEEASAPTPAATPGAEAGEEAPEAVEEGGVEPEFEEVAPEEEFVPEEEEIVPEEVAPETGGAGGGVGEEEVVPEGGGGSESGGVGPG